MYAVNVKYRYNYEAYGKTQAASANELFIVSADTQYESIEKTKRFLLGRKPEIEFTDISSNWLESGLYFYMLSGVIN